MSIPCIDCGFDVPIDGFIPGAQIYCNCGSEIIVPLMPPPMFRLPTDSPSVRGFINLPPTAYGRLGTPAARQPSVPQDTTLEIIGKAFLAAGAEVFKREAPRFAGNLANDIAYELSEDEVVADVADAVVSVLVKHLVK